MISMMRATNGRQKAAQLATASGATSTLQKRRRHWPRSQKAGMSTTKIFVGESSCGCGRAATASCAAVKTTPQLLTSAATSQTPRSTRSSWEPHPRRRRNPGRWSRRGTTAHSTRTFSCTTATSGLRTKTDDFWRGLYEATGIPRDRIRFSEVAKPGPAYACSPTESYDECRKSGRDLNLYSIPDGYEKEDVNNQQETSSRAPTTSLASSPGTAPRPSSRSSSASTQGVTPAPSTSRMPEQLKDTILFFLLVPIVSEIGAMLAPLAVISRIISMVDIAG
ncbi:hypothetical protein MAPG_07811 [Magnaporthiopsis poae ATCC 64411]|uniref:Uncharacterized protein n=1 Tax=Magnaporthiopsis poae (strain ATCC 64411 / 73-15) TaxID=644358 RepID=A0A0C4E5N7_MAGP6|nr:hypothetical protein MAPG_07811 [Magnaporthiopsis poae ATCC 64411]